MEAVLGVAAGIFAVGFVVLVWRKGFGELSFTAGKVNARLVARQLESIGRAVNHRDDGEPPLVERVIEIETLQHAQTETLDEHTRQLAEILDRLDHLAPPS